MQLLDDLRQIVRRRLGELRDADISDSALAVHHEVPFLHGVEHALIAQDAIDHNFGAIHTDVHGLLGVLVQDRQRDFLTGLALDEIDGLFHGHVFGGDTVDLDNKIAGFNPRLVGWRADDGTFHENLVGAVEADLDADAAELAAAGLHEVFVFLGIDKSGVRIELLQPQVEHILEQFPHSLFAEGLDVFALNFLNRLDHEPIVFVLGLKGALRRGALQDGQGEKIGRGNADSQARFQRDMKTNPPAGIEKRQPSQQRNGR